MNLAAAAISGGVGCVFLELKLAVPPNALRVAQTVQHVLPASANATVLSALSGASSNSAPAASGSMQQQLQQLAGQPTAPLGGQNTGTFKVASTSALSEREALWRTDEPPAAWPVFPTEHELSQPAPKRGSAEALAMAKRIEERWRSYKLDRAKDRPSALDIREAERALLTIAVGDPAFREAWARFVRLRGIEREATA